MALKIYLDDCAFSHLLDDYLRRAGHTVLVPANVNLTGSPDYAHFRFAAERGLILVTKNPADFLELHERNPNHSGIIAIYQDNDVSRDMSDAEIASVISSLERLYAQQHLPFSRAFINLNQWRYLSQEAAFSAQTSLATSPSQEQKSRKSRRKK